VRRIAIVAVGVLLMSACTSGGSVTKHLWENWGDPIASPDADFPLLGIVDPQAIFRGGYAGFHPIYGSMAELEWTVGSISIQLSSFERRDMEASLQDLIKDRMASPDAVRLKDAWVRGFRAVHVSSEGFDRFLWLDGPAVVEARLSNDRGPLGPVLASIAELEPEAFHDLVGAFSVP